MKSARSCAHALVAGASVRSSLLSRSLVLALALIAIAAQASALVPCRSQYDDVREAVAHAWLPARAQRSVLKQMQNAWRIAHAAATDSRTSALLTTDSAKRALGGPAFRNVSGEQTAKIGAAIDAFASCIRSSDPVVPVPVTARVFTAPGKPAGAGIPVSVDGESVATTAADGTATLMVVPADHRFSAVQRGKNDGSTSATIQQGTAAALDIVLDPNDFATAAELQIDEASDAVVAGDFTSFTLRLVDSADGTIAVDRIIELQLMSSGTITNIAPLFSVSTNGTAVASDAAAFRALLVDRFGPYDIRFRAIDSSGTTYEGGGNFDLGRHTPYGSVEAPPGVDVSSLPVHLTNQRDHLSFWQTTAADGTLTFPALLPEGSYIVGCEFVRNGVRYHATDAFVLDADKNFTITLIPPSSRASEESPNVQQEPTRPQTIHLTACVAFLHCRVRGAAPSHTGTRHDVCTGRNDRCVDADLLAKR